MIPVRDFRRRAAAPVQPLSEILHRHRMRDRHGSHAHVHGVQSVSDLPSPTLFADCHEAQGYGLCKRKPLRSRASRATSTKVLLRRCR